MFFLHPMQTINSLGSSAASSGFTKLKNHFNLAENLKQKIAQNPAFATFSTAGITAALIHPTTRVALCTLLRMSYSMSMITLNLVMIGLYLGWIGMKGAKGLMKTAHSTFSQAAEQMKSVKLPEPEASKGAPQAPSAPSEHLRPAAPNPENWVQQFEEEFPSAPNIVDKLEPQKWADEYSYDLVDEALQDFEKAEKPSPKHPQSDTPRPLQPKVNNWANEFSQVPGIKQPNGHDWANELASNARKLPQFNVGEFLQFNNEVVADQWAGEFVCEQAKRGVPNLVKYAGGALAVGAGVFAAVKIYQALKENDLEEDGVQETSYANTTSDQVKNGTESAQYYGMMTENPLF